MKYWFEPYWVSSGPAKSVPNFTLSEKDKEWIQAYYPKNINPNEFPRIYVEFVDGPEWKKKWVIKMIAENLSPITGIVWTFPEYNLVIDPSMNSQKKALGAFPTKKIALEKRLEKIRESNVPLGYHNEQLEQFFQF